MIYPVDAPLGQKFGADPETYAQFGMKGHNGVDWIVPIGTPVKAPENGVVVICGENVQDQYTGAPIGGKTIVVKGIYEHWLLHNSKLLVAVGEYVNEGQVIALSGNSGFVSPAPTPSNPTAGAHCHQGARPLSPDLANGYRGFIDPLTIKEEQVSKPNDGDVDNAFLFVNGRKATDKEKQDYTTKDWGAEDGLFYGKVLIDVRNIRSALETSGNNAGAAAKLDEIKKIVGV